MRPRPLLALLLLALPWTLPGCPGSADEDGDGIDDLLVGAPQGAFHEPESYKGGAYLFLGRSGGFLETVPVDDAAIRFRGEEFDPSGGPSATWPATPWPPGAAGAATRRPDPWPSVTPAAPTTATNAMCHMCATPARWRGTTRRKSHLP